MIEIYNVANIGPGALISFTGSPNNKSAKEVVLREVNLSTGVQTIVQRQNIPPGGGYFLEMPTDPGKALYFVVAFIDANGKDTEGSSVVSVIPG